MHDGRHPKRLARLPRARVLVLATLVSVVLVAACGGSSDHSGIFGMVNGPCFAVLEAVT
jgi:hypothetical protein